MGLVAPRLHPEPVNHKWNRDLTWYLGGAGLRLQLVRARSRKQAPVCSVLRNLQPQASPRSFIQQSCLALPSHLGKLTGPSYCLCLAMQTSYHDHTLHRYPALAWNWRREPGGGVRGRSPGGTQLFWVGRKALGQQGAP